MATEENLFNREYFELSKKQQELLKLKLAVLIKHEYEDLKIVEEFDGTLYEYFIHKQKDAEAYEEYGIAQAIKEIIDGASRHMD